MEKTILFQKNASVLTANGQQIGSLERVVLNPESKLVTDIVVRTGPLFNKEDRVVPVEQVAETTERQILLHAEAKEVDSFPPFEERYLVEEPEEAAKATPVTHGTPGFYGPMIVEDQYVTQIEQNIPKGTVAMKEGAKVISAEGKYVGNVERVLADASVDQVTNLEISKGLFTKEWWLIPMKWVMTVGEDEVHLRVNEAAIDNE